MRYLVILNRRFPFKYGEAFLENEVDEISKCFDRVIILPSDMTSRDEQTRVIKSSNVEVITYEESSLKKRQLSYCLGGLWDKKDSEAKGFRDWLYSGYFNHAVKLQCRNIYKAISKYNFNKEDTVVLYSYWLFISAKVAISLKEVLQQHTNVICVSRAHAFDIYEENRYLPERKEILQKIDAVLPCSDNGTRYLKSKYPECAGKIQTAYLGTYDKGTIKGSKCQGALKLVSCSRIAPEKRIDLIIESLKLLKDEDIAIEWTHIGGGPQLNELIQRAANELGFIKTHFTGSISNHEVYAHYMEDEYDLFLNTSSAEGLPVSIMEAISLGIPVVATDVGGTSEIVVDGISGTLISSDFKPSELAELISSYAKMDDIQYENLRISARRLWEEKFQAPVNYKKFAENIMTIERNS